MITQIKQKIAQIVIIIFIFLISLISVYAQENASKGPMTVNGDKVEFFSAEKKVVAEGNVVITQQDVKLVCDKVTVYSSTQDAIAEGNVIFYFKNGILKADKFIYNFQNKKGRLIEANIESKPFYGKGKFAEKVSEYELKMKHGYFTTCDLKEPHYRLQARDLDVFPGDKIVAKDILFLAGKAPLMYMPSYIHPIDDRRPRVTVLPGYSKNWGYYMFTAWRYYFNENAKGRLHLDYRERKDFAWGVDYKYKIENLGDGLFKTYYMNERNIQPKHFWQVPRDTVEKERFRIQLRHNWEINTQDHVILQYNKIKDTSFLKDYFYRENEKDTAPETFFLFTHTVPDYTFSFLTKKRTSRIFDEVERLPELKLESPDLNILTSSFNPESPSLTNFYFKTQNSFSNLDHKGASPSDVSDEAKRFDTYDQLSLQRKVSFIETRPYVGFRETYYSKDIFRRENLFRAVFYSGVDLSTKFYRIFETKSDFLGIEINRLRHIITPSAKYAYIHPPTISSSNLTNFDSIDSISRDNKVTLELQNKLQTKRENDTVDFVNFRVFSDYSFKPKGGTGSSFSDINFDLETIPYKWLRIDADASYDHRNDYFKTVNADLTADGGDKWSASIGQRYQRKGSKQLTSNFSYRINPKWKFSVYERYQLSGTGFIRGLREQEYSVERDLHCWTVSINYNVRRVAGEEIWIIFKIKAFPEMGFEFNKSYHEPKAGSQSPWSLQ